MDGLAFYIGMGVGHWIIPLLPLCLGWL